MIKKGKEVSLRCTFSQTPAIPVHRTADKTGRDRRQVAGTRKKSELTDFEKFAADKPRRAACKETL